jgi:hypothetical protein
MHEFSPFQTEDQVVIGFIDMDDPEVMKFQISCFFLYHNIYDCAPAFKRIALGKA